MDRALLALDRGWDPEHIVAETRFSESGWSGKESQHWQRKVDAFARLRQEAAVPQDARRARIITAGIAYFERLRAAAAPARAPGAHLRQLIAVRGHSEAAFGGTGRPPDRLPDRRDWLTLYGPARAGSVRSQGTRDELGEAALPRRSRLCRLHLRQQ